MTKLKPSFKIFLVVLLAGALFGGYYAFMPKKQKTENVTAQSSVDTTTTNSVTVVENTSTVSTNSPAVNTLTYQAAEVKTTEAKELTTKTNTSSETKSIKPKSKKETTKAVEPKKKKSEDRENLNVNFN